MTLPVPQADWALFLDFDGTLVNLAGTPSEVSIPPGLTGMLDRVAEALNGALALVSGRSLAQLDAFLAPLRLPTAGLHGLELRFPDGTCHSDDSAAAAVERARQSLAGFAARHCEVMLEDKGLSLALHYRSAPQLASASRAAAERAIAAGGDQLVLLPGKMVLELKPNGTDKGQAVRRLLDLPPFAGRLPVFVGDDVTDEAGFAVVNALGGISIRVGDSHDTRAQHRAAGVEQVLDWLAAFRPVTQQQQQQEATIHDRSQSGHHR